MAYEDDIATINDLVKRITPLLAGHRPDVQSAVLAHLVAIGLASHQDLENPDGANITEFREGLLSLFVDYVRELTPMFTQTITRFAADKNRRC